MTEKKEIKIAFHPKSSWQKGDCINRFQEYDCPNESTLQVDVVEGIPKNDGVTIRCCTEEKCKERAIDIAMHTVAVMLGVSRNNIKVTQ